MQYENKTNYTEVRELMFRMPKCKCGKRMKRWALHIDLWGNEVFECENCGMGMKKVPFGDPDKKTYIFFVLLSLFFTKKLWIEPIEKKVEG